MTLNLTERRAAARAAGGGDAADIAPFARALDGADEDERAALAKALPPSRLFNAEGRRPGLALCWPHWANQARGGDAGAGGHGTQARIWRATAR